MAFCIEEFMYLSYSKLHSLHLIDDVLCFFTVGTNVLNCQLSHFSINQGEVLCPTPSLLNGECHKVVSNNSNSYSYNYGCIVFLHPIDTSNSTLKHKAIIITKEEQVTTSSHMENKLMMKLRSQRLQYLH